MYEYCETFNELIKEKGGGQEGAWNLFGSRVAATHQLGMYRVFAGMFPCHRSWIYPTGPCCTRWIIVLAVPS